MSSEDLLGALLVDTVGQWEAEFLDKELLHVRSADVSGLLDFYNLENLQFLLGKEATL